MSELICYTDSKISTRSFPLACFFQFYFLRFIIENTFVQFNIFSNDSACTKVKKQIKNLYLYYITFVTIVNRQNLLHGHIQDAGKRHQVVHSGQADTVLPFVDSLRGRKAQEFLEFPDGNSGAFTQDADILSGFVQIHYRMRIWIPPFPSLCLYCLLDSNQQLPCLQARFSTRLRYGSI